MLRDAEPLGRGERPRARRDGLRGTRDDELGFRLDAGPPDNSVGLAETLAHLSLIAAAVDLPVNADFQNGFAAEPEGVAANVGRAVQTGVAGLSIEDFSGDPAEPLFELGLAVERIRAARAAIDDSDTGVVLTARSEGFVWDRPDIDETIRRLQAYAEAGADCLYAPFITSLDQVSAIVAAVAPKPVNLLIHTPFTTVAEAAGARRPTDQRRRDARQDRLARVPGRGEGRSRSREPSRSSSTCRT